MPADRKERKSMSIILCWWWRLDELFAQAANYVNQYKKIIFVRVENVTSAQMQQIRKALRGKAVVMMGKNTMIRRSLRNMLSQKPEIERVCTVT